MADRDDAGNLLLALRDIGITDVSYEVLERKVQLALADEIGEAPRRRLRRAALRPVGGRVLMALSVAVPIAIVVAAIALLAHTPRTAVRLGRQPAITARHPVGSAVPSGYSRVAASVIARDPRLWYEVIEINRGRLDGVALNDPVTGRGTLIGRISTVTRTTATVKLITDPGTVIAAQVEDFSGNTGMLRSKTGNPRELLLTDRPNNVPVSSGQRVVTARPAPGSTASPYPAGIPIGQTTKPSANEHLGHGIVAVRPAADSRHVDAVQVLTKPAWLSQLETRFAVFRKPPDKLPTAIAKQLVRFGVSSQGLSYAHRVVFPNGTLWLIPEPSELCAAIISPGSHAITGQTCETGNPVPGGLGMSVGSREHLNGPFNHSNPLVATKAGVVDNNVTSVNYTQRDGQTATQAIKDNAFLVDTLPGDVVKRVR